MNIAFNRDDCLPAKTKLLINFGVNLLQELTKWKQIKLTIYYVKSK